MPPTLALILTLAFIAYLFRRDLRERPDITGALWLPAIWVFIVCSRTLSQWLYLFGLPGFASTSIEEGSWLDALVLLCMILLGLHILRKRQVKLSEIARENRWLVVFLVYCLVSAVWADSPLISGKRWIKMLGHPIMVLVIFTEPNPQEALARLMRRCAYIVFPISILWTKYYPALGRQFGPDGAAQNAGITLTKNDFGAVSIIFALFFLWHALQLWKQKNAPGRRDELLLTLGLLLLTGYCLGKAHSATSTLSLLLSALVMLCLGLRFVDKRMLRAYVVALIFVLLVAQGLFNVFGAVVDASGHGSTLEGRGHLWEVVLATDANPVLGAGFESYWSGERLQKIWSMPEFWWKPIQAHNGYIEVYINLGIVGLIILLGVLFVTFAKCHRELIEQFEWGRLMMAYFAMILIHNWTEAGFKGLSMMFFVFFLAAIRLSRPTWLPEETQPLGAEQDDGVAYASTAYSRF